MKIKFKSFNIGDDILILIIGGKKHIGAVSLYENNNFKTIERIGHKDSVITKMVSKNIYKKLKKNVLVICGIHKNNASKKDIKKIIKKVKRKTKKWIKNNN